MANNVIVRNTNSDGQLQDGSYFENAATNEVLEEVGNFITAGNKAEAKRDADSAKAAKARHKADQTQRDDHQDENNKSNYGIMSNLGKMVTELGNIGIRAYKMEVDVGKDVKGAVNAVTALTKSIVGVVGMFAGGVVGKLGKLAGVADKLPVSLGGIGKGFDEVFKALGKGVDFTIDELAKYHKELRKASSAGADFGGNITLFKAVSAQARMSVGEFSELIKSSGQEFAGITSNISAGVQQFAMTVDEFADNGGMKELKQLGFTTEQITKMLQRQMTMQRRRDFDDAAVREQEMESATAYAKQLDALARLTGKERAEIEKKITDRRREAENDATIRQLDRDGSRGVAAAFNTLLGTVGQFGEGAEKAFQEIFQRGTVYSEEGMAAMAALGSAGDEIMQAALRARQGGDVSDIAVDVGGAIIKRINEDDFLEMAKLAPFGNKTAEEAANILVAGGKLSDALIDSGKKIPEFLSDSMSKELFKDAMERIKEQQKKQIEEQGRETGTAFGGLLNDLETGMENVGASMNEQMFSFTESIKIGDVALGARLASLAETVRIGTEAVSTFISPEERLNQKYSEQEKLALEATRKLKDKAKLQQEELDAAEKSKKTAEAETARIKKQGEEAAQQLKEGRRDPFTGALIEQKKLTSEVVSDLEIVTNKLTEFTDNAFAKIGVDSAAIRKDMMAAMREWKADSKAWLLEAGIDVDKIWSRFQDYIVEPLKWLGEVMADLAKAVLTWIGIDVEKLGAKIGEGLDWANIKAGSLYSDGKEAISTVAGAAMGDENDQEKLAEAVEDVLGPMPQQFYDSAKEGIIDGFNYVVQQADSFISSDATPVSIESIAPSVNSINPPANNKPYVETTAGEKDFEAAEAQQDQLNRIEQNYLTFANTQYSILEELKTLNTTSTHGNDISDYQARQQMQTNNKLGSLKSNRNDIHAVLQ